MTDARLGRIVWYELLTSDMKAAEAFYTTVVGWTVAAFDQSPHPYDTWNRSGDVAIGGVMTIPDGMNFPPHWEMYVEVPSLDDAVAKVERLGGSALGPVIDVPTVGRLRTMTDPQGALFALYEATTPMERPEAAPVVGDGSWHELYTTDAEAAMRFYTGMFGWTPTETMDMGPMGKYHMFGRAFPLGGMMNKSSEMGDIPPNWNVYFRVPDINAATEKVKSSGGHVLNGPMEVPGGSWIVNCLDPQGAAFSLHQEKAG
jgi:predicted enzyme related to lactoylglutathione lyase